MIKLVTLLTRRPGMSKEDFVSYYETRHRLIGEKYLGGRAVRYFRRHLTPLDGAAREGDSDVVMEIWFRTRAELDACFAALTQGEAAAEIAADEEKLFDRTKIRSFLVEECESALPAV
jgi:hypothetical protein